MLLAGLGAVGAFVVWRMDSLSRLPTEEEAKAKAAAKAKAELEAALSPPTAPKPYDGPRFSTPEEIVANYKTAMEHTVHAQGVLVGDLVEYSLCRAFELGNESPCARIDPRLKGPKMSPPCRAAFFEAYAVRSAVAGHPDLDACLAFLKATEAGDSSPQTDRKWCEEAGKHLAQGTVDEMCDGLIRDGDMPAAARQQCMRISAYLSGEEKCREIIPEEGSRRTCARKAAFIRALREKKPELAAATPYAPLLLEKKGLCTQFGAKAVATFEDDAVGSHNEKAREEFEALRLAAKKRARLKEIEEEGAKNEALLREAESKRLAFEAQHAKAAAEEKKQAEERQKQVDEWLAKEEKAKTERAAKKGQEEKLKFEAARRTDEARRVKAGLPMEEEKARAAQLKARAEAKAKAKAKGTTKADKESGADAVMISSDKEEEESQ